MMIPITWQLPALRGRGGGGGGPARVRVQRQRPIGQPLPAERGEVVDAASQPCGDA